MPDKERRRIFSIDAAERVKRAMLTGLAERLREQPEAFSKLVELGLVDQDLLERDVEEVDLVSVIRRFRDRVAEIAQTEPSVLQTLDIRPLEVMRDDEEPAGVLDTARVPLTVVFCDLEGFTSFTSERGDVEAAALLRDHYDTVDAIVRSRGGSVAKKLGDGHMLGFPQAAAAVTAALELVDAAPRPLRLRAGAHAGPVMRADGDLFGHVVNVASRVTDLATGGMTMITGDVRDAAGHLPHIVYRQARREQLAGLHEPVEVCEVAAG